MAHLPFVSERPLRADYMTDGPCQRDSKWQPIGLFAAVSCHRRLGRHV